MAVKPRYLWLLLVTFVFHITVLGQQFPPSSGTCRISSSGTESCNWASQISRLNPPKSSTAINTSPHGDNIVLFTTMYVLSPGAPLHRPVDGYDNVFVPLTAGTLQNQAVPSQEPFSFDTKQVFLMPQTEKYLLRNVGGKGSNFVANRASDRPNAEIVTENPLPRGISR